MLPVLTQYLVQYGRVCIPHIGTFEIVQEAPRLEIAEKLLMPPFYTTAFSEKDMIPEHQLQFLSKASNQLKKELLSFGESLRSRIDDAPVHLSGFGKLHCRSNVIVFEPETIRPTALQAIPAEKVMRENALHNVLVGDREMVRQHSGSVSRPSRKRSLVMTIGWIALALAVAAIGAVLYFGRFEVASSGLRLHP